SSSWPTPAGRVSSTPRRCCWPRSRLAWKRRRTRCASERPKRTTTVLDATMGETITFWVLAVVSVSAALGLVFSRRAVYCALMLGVVMISLAVLYAIQDAPFLAAVQIIVYTGAVMMLFLFVLMLVGVDTRDSLVETIRGQRFWAAVAGLGFAVLLALAIGQAVTADPVGLGEATQAAGGNVPALAPLIFTRHVFAFEVASALLITA